MSAARAAPLGVFDSGLGGLTVVDVADEDAARMWAGKIAEACGWPQEVRLFGAMPDLEST